MRAYVNPDECISCGLCISLVPEVFAADEDGKAKAVTDTTDDVRAAVEEAADSCPVSAIHPEGEPG